MNDHVMLDLETLGVTADSAIISIGAYVFSGPNARRDFYATADPFSQNRKISPDTVAWWQKQSEQARAVFNDAKTPLPRVLKSFSAFMAPLKEVRVWGNGSDFDNAMLNHAFNGAPPWKPWNNRCYRTLAAQYPNKKRVQTGVYHHALDDAKSQAGHLLELMGGSYLALL